MFEPLSRPLRNFELTKQALDYIWKNGRNTFDLMSQQKTREQLKEEGWLNETTHIDNPDW